MQTREIQHNRWSSFFDDFSQLNRGKRVNVETMVDRRQPPKPAVRDQPLLAIVTTADAPGITEQVEVIAGGVPVIQGICCVSNPRHVWVGEENGELIAVQIESGDGSQTIIRFEPPRHGMPGGFTIA
jgi:hypothetical protein